MKIVPVALSAKELVLTPAMVARAKALGLNLNEFAPDAEEGNKLAGGGWAGAKYWQKDPAVAEANKEKAKNFGKSLFSKAKGMFDDGSVADIFNISTAASNWNKAVNTKAPQVAEQFIAPPKLLNDKVDTSEQMNQIALGSNAAREAIKLRGGDAYSGELGIHAQELDKRVGVASQANNQAIAIDNQNTAMKNEYSQHVADSIYNRSMKQMEVNGAVQDKRDAAIGNAQSAISDTLRERANYHHDLNMMDKSRTALQAPDQVAAIMKAYPKNFPAGMTPQMAMQEMIDLGGAGFKAKYKIG